MPMFSVPIKKIDRVFKHPNADKLELANINGMSWQFVVSKGEYAVGDKVVFFPVDSVLPEELIDELGIRMFLGGSKKNRVRTAIIRGEPSQGIVIKLDVIMRFLHTDDIPEDLDVDLEEALGVKKYNPPPIMVKEGDLVRKPAHVSKFDVESSDNFPDVETALMDVEVIVTEKVEGTNWWCSACDDGKVWVGQRQHSITESDGKNVFWECARESGILEFCQKYSRDNNCYFNLRGELTGPKIQGNYYGLEKPKIFLYAAQINGKYIDSVDFFDLMVANNIYNLVPILSRNYKETLGEWLGDDTLSDASGGQSEINGNVLREGVVIVSKIEQTHEKLGRLMLKKRSPRYLAKTGF